MARPVSLGQILHCADFIVSDFNLEDPVAVEFKASIAGKALAAEGMVGPFGHKDGHGPLPVDLAPVALDIPETEERDQVGTGKVRINPLQIEEDKH